MASAGARRRRRRRAAAARATAVWRRGGAGAATHAASDAAAPRCADGREVLSSSRSGENRPVAPWLSVRHRVLTKSNRNALNSNLARREFAPCDRFRAASALRPPPASASPSSARTGAEVDVAGDEGVADVAGEHEGDAAVAHLLVLRPSARPAPRRRAASPGMSARPALHPHGGEVRRDPARRLLRAEPERGPRARRRAGSRSPPPRRAAAGRNSRWRPRARGRRCGRGSGARARPARSRRARRSRPSSRRSGAPRGARAAASPARERRAVRLEPGEEAGVAEQAVLRHLGVAGEEVARAAGCRAAPVSASTSRGWWKAPIRFLPWAELMPVLPPTELSTWASSVVGTCTKPTPAAQHRRGEAGEVADHPAAEGDHEVVARRPSRRSATRRRARAPPSPWSPRPAAAPAPPPAMPGGRQPVAERRRGAAPPPAPRSGPRPAAGGAAARSRRPARASRPGPMRMS